ncbi:MAG: DNA recombination protein RmuC [Clostridiales Family XIII bacterium]|nr:DNA recombination protein RmuC [Clostridiales Family XIII bacterium]
MDWQMAVSIAILVLIAVVIVLQIIGRGKSNRKEINELLGAGAEEMRETVAKQISDGATEQFRRFGVIQESVRQTLQESRTETNEQLDKFSARLDARLSTIQEQTQSTLRSSRDEINKQLREFGERVDDRLSSIQRGNTENLEKVNATLEVKMKSLQESNEKRLEQMQAVVDEKLQKTLETRLAQSFELVSKQLDSVQQGLGEMKNLAADAKSLKNALTNVKERGTYGEVRLERLLSDILTPTQYDINVEISNNKRVDFVIKLPGNGDVPLLLPIDSKFPIEDYNRLLDAEDKAAIDEARKSLAAKIRVFAKDICEKYIVPPKTTDFALMFLPTEGLYAEVVQNAALFEEIRDKYKVTAIGATTLSAFLSSLQMGFKTLAIEQRSQEVWDTLRAVKSEFVKFGKSLETAQKQLQTADKTLEEIVGRRTRAINKTLRSVEELSEAETPRVIEEPGSADDDED